MLRFSRICVCVLLLWGGAEVTFAQNVDPLIGKEAGEAQSITIPDQGGELAMRWCPPGTFTMGTPGDTRKEKPIEVTLTQGFWMFQTETTQGQYTAVMGTTPWDVPDNEFNKVGEHYPASYITRPEAEAYCTTLTEIAHKRDRLTSQWRFALPTEAQWEYACRAGTTTTYSFGADKSQLGDYAWCQANAWDVDEKYAHTVGTKKPNPWGLSDMHGNVWEWCRDMSSDHLIGGDDPLSTRAGSSTPGCVLRGGSWATSSVDHRSANRSKWESPDYRGIVSIGFRVVCVRTP